MGLLAQLALTNRFKLLKPHRGECSGADLTVRSAIRKLTDSNRSKHRAERRILARKTLSMVGRRRH